MSEGRFPGAAHRDDREAQMSLLPHIADFEFAAFDANELGADEKSRITAHLSTCMVCRLRLESVQDSDLAPPDNLTLPSEARGPSQWLVDAMRSGERPEPAPGQLWRVVRGDVAEAAAVFAVWEDGVTVAPVTFDVEMADEYTLLLDEESTPLSTALAVWVGERTVVPIELLAQVLGDVGNVDAMHAVHDAYVSGEPVSGAKVGRAPVRSYEPRSLYREELRTRWQMLAVAWEDEDDESGASSVNLDAEDDARRVIAVLEDIDDVYAKDDEHGEDIAAAVAPLIPVCVAWVFDASVRVCLAPFDDLADATSALTGATRTATLLGDCDHVAVVAPNDELDTLILQAADIHPAYITPVAASAQSDLSQSISLPLHTAMRRLKGEYEPQIEPLEIQTLERSIAPAEDLARRHARAALDELAGASVRIEEKVAALSTLNDEPATLLLEEIVLAARRGDVTHVTRTLESFGATQ